MIMKSLHSMHFSFLDLVDLASACLTLSFVDICQQRYVNKFILMTHSSDSKEGFFRRAYCRLGLSWIPDRLDIVSRNKYVNKLIMMTHSSGRGFISQGSQ